MKNHEEEVQIIVKEPPQYFDYENFYHKNQQNLVQFKEETL